MSAEKQRLEQLLDAIGETETEELDCDGTLERLASYVESLETNARSAALQQVEQHLLVCACCAQELACLLEALRGMEG